MRIFSIKLGGCVLKINETVGRSFCLGRLVWNVKLLLRVRVIEIGLGLGLVL